MKSRMRENCTYGSVRGSRQAFHIRIKKGVSRLSTRLNKMTGLGASVMYDGYVKGIKEGQHNLLMAVRSLMCKQNLTAEEALEELDIPVSDRAGYLAQL